MSSERPGHGDDHSRVETSGIESGVYADDDLVGHVLLLDYDETSRDRVLSDAEEIDGPSVVLSSSPGSWHVYGLAVRSWESTLRAARSSSASEAYIEEMDRRGESTLRIGAKGDEPAPSVEAVDVPSEGSGTVSRPHCSILRELCDVDELELLLRALEAGIVDDIEPVGEQAVRSRYETDAPEEVVDG